MPKETVENLWISVKQIKNYKYVWLKMNGFVIS